MLGLPARVLSLPSALRGASRPSQRALGTSGVWGCQEGGATAAGRGTLCSSGAPRASPPGPPRRTANQNHSARMGTRRTPSCSQRPPGDLTRCQALLAAAQGGGGAVRAADTPHPRPAPAPCHPQGYWLPAAKWSLHALLPSCLHKSCCSEQGPAPEFAGGPLSAGHPARRCV